MRIEHADRRRSVWRNEITHNTNGHRTQQMCKTIERIAISNWRITDWANANGTTHSALCIVAAGRQWLNALPVVDVRTSTNSLVHNGVACVCAARVYVLSVVLCVHGLEIWHFVWIKNIDCLQRRLTLNVVTRTSRFAYVFCYVFVWQDITRTLAIAHISVCAFLFYSRPSFCKMFHIRALEH